MFLFTIRNVLSHLFIWLTYTTGRVGYQMFLWPLRGKVTLLPRLLVVVQLLRLVILVFEECSELHGEGLLFVVGCWLLCDHYVWSYWFSKDVLNFTGGLLFIVGCWLLCNRYVWSYWFSLRLTWTAFVSPIWSHACCLLWSVRLFAMVSLAVSYNAKDILFRDGEKILYFPTVWWNLSTCALCFCSWKENCFKLNYFETVLQKPGGLVRQGNLVVYCLFSMALTWKWVWRPWALDGRIRRH